METASMRSAWLKIALFFLCVTAQAQVNPHTQIRWPTNCNNPNMLYNWQNNTCINAVVGPLVDPGTQMNWPPSCNAPNMTYNYATRTCFSGAVAIAAGTTATLPPGSPATVTQTGSFPNYTLNFGIPTGTPGGSLSYPGVVTDNNNGLNISGGQALGSTSTPAVFYYSGDSPPKHPGVNNAADVMSLNCSNTISSYFNGAGTTSNGGTAHYCLDMAGSRWSAPGINLGGTSPFGATGWSRQTIFSANSIIVNSPGLTNALSTGLTKAGIGDNANYMYEVDYGGFVAGQDEGMYGLGLASSEAGTVYTGTVASGSIGTGAQSLKVNCTADCPYPGDGRYLLDMTNPVTGYVTAKTLPSGNFTPGTYTTDVAVTPSTAWCTANADINTPQPTTPALAGVQATSMQWVCNSGPGNTGSFAIGDLICFAGQYHEQSKLTAVSGTGPWTLTAPLRHTHERLSWVVANGSCGTFIELTADTVPVSASGTNLPAQTLRYPMDILGGPDAHTLWWRQFAGGSSTGNLSSNLKLTQAVSGTVTNVGGIVTFNSFTASQGSLSNPFFNQPVLAISGTGTAFDTQCTNSVADATGHLTCSQAASTGLGPISGMNLSIGPSATGNGGFNLYRGAETLDVQTYTTTPPSVSPSNVTTFALEPNNAPWTYTDPTHNDAVEQPHHYSIQAHIGRDTYVIYNAMNYGTNIRNIAGGGPGFRGGNVGAATQNFSAYYISNTQPASYYQYHGGIFTPPGGIALGGPSNAGIFNYGVWMANAPDPVGSSALWIGCPYSGCNDPSFSYNIFTALGNGSSGLGNGALTWIPNTKTFTWGSGSQMDFFNLPIYRPTIQSASNGATATLKFNAIDSGAVSHSVTIVAPITGNTGGFNFTLPFLTANANLSATGSGTQAWGMNTLVAGTVTVNNAAACIPTGTACVYQLTRCNPQSSTAIGSLAVSVSVVPGTSFIINSLSATNTVVTGDLSSVCWRIN
jgi:hypothetical protein